MVISCLWDEYAGIVDVCKCQDMAPPLNEYRMMAFISTALKGPQLSWHE